MTNFKESILATHYDLNANQDFTRNRKHEGESLYDLKTVLGHADIKTTERYAHLSNEHLAGVNAKPKTQNHPRSTHAQIKNEQFASF